MHHLSFRALANDVNSTKSQRNYIRHQGDLKITFFKARIKKITKVKLKCLKFCAHQISWNVVHVVGIPVCNAIILYNVAFRDVKSLQNDPVIF